MPERDSFRREPPVTASLVNITMSEQKLASSVAQRIITKFLTTKGVKLLKISRRLKTQFGNNTFKKIQVYMWHKPFLRGRKAVENESLRRRAPEDQRN